MKLSVAMCTYNGEKYIKDQIDSILNQSTPIQQIIICDDGSTDATIKIIEQYQLEHPGIITLEKNPINLRSNKNFEKAISICDGDYIFLSDQDDVWKVNKVEKIIEHFSKNETLEAVFTDADLINDQNDKYSNKSLWTSFYFFEDLLKKPIDLYKLLKFRSTMVTGATLCIKKEIKKLILPIPDIKNYYHDEWIATVAASRNRLDYLPYKLISYRIHSAQQAGIENKDQTKKKAKKSLAIINHQLGNTFPKSYSQYKRLSNNYFRNYYKFKIFAKQIEGDPQQIFEKISEENLSLFKETELKLEKINSFLYFFKKKIDQLKGKRQLK
ncbi:glycosyltransferase family 2 protein [Flavobacterium laiguense]|uniref:Glycosyl transferase n=1 Tax=Flavobacterium laiguense TaxID=2169409 RepID=A0A2U1K051_9FLAO|nr:glycosyltransferase family 2 protein [Flavobacterium laiguense]PWA10877.1 glycosyl transferase [Flavobacterium laiguense]